MKKKASNSADGKAHVRPEPNAKEAATIAKLKERYDAFAERPHSAVSVDNGKMVIECGPDTPDKLYTVGTFAAVGSTSLPFLNTVMNQVMEISGRDEEAYNAALAIMAAVEPENELEGLMASQMVVAHMGAMRCAKLASGAMMIDQLQVLDGLANKYLRTFTAQMEALSKIRRGGTQIVKHVHVHEGGQAVVADEFHQHQAGGRRQDEGQSDAAIIEAGRAGERPALRRPDPARDGVPLPGYEERPLSYARRDESGSAEG